MLPSVTSFRIFKKSRDTFSAPIEWISPLALSGPSVAKAVSQTPQRSVLPCAPPQSLRKQRLPLLSRLQSPCQPLPGCPHWDGTQHFKLNHCQRNSSPSPHPVSRCWHHHLLGGPRQGPSAPPPSST